MKVTSIKTGYVVTEDKKKIHYDHYTGGHDKVIVLAHGFYNSKQAVLFKDMAAVLNDAYDIIVMDFRGHGKSDGPFDWTAKEYKDLEAVLHYAHKQYTAIGVVGFSLGAATSIITAVRGDLIKSLVVVSPPTDFDKIDKHFWKMCIKENIIYNVFKEGRIGKGVMPGNLWLKKIKPIDVIQDIKSPVLFVCGKKDWLILPWHARALYEKAKGVKKLEIFEEGTHAEYIYRSHKEQTLKMFKEWFAKTL